MWPQSVSCIAGRVGYGISDFPSHGSHSFPKLSVALCPGFRGDTETQQGSPSPLFYLNVKGCGCASGSVDVDSRPPMDTSPSI